VSQALSGNANVNSQEKNVTLPEGFEGCLIVIKPEVSTT